MINNICTKIIMIIAGIIVVGMFSLISIALLISIINSFDFASLLFTIGFIIATIIIAVAYIITIIFKWKFE